MKRPSVTFGTVSEKKLEKPLALLGSNGPNVSKAFYFVWGGSELTLAIQGFKRTLGDPTKSALQPKGNKQVGTGTVTPKSKFPDPRTRCFTWGLLRPGSYAQAENRDWQDSLPFSLNSQV